MNNKIISIYEKKLSEISQLSQTRKLVLTDRKNNLIVNRNDKNLISHISQIKYTNEKKDEPRYGFEIKIEGEIT